MGRFIAPPVFFSLLAIAFWTAGCDMQQFPPASIEDVNQLQRRVEALSKRISMLEQAVSQWSKSIDDTEKATRQSRADQSVLIEDLRTELKTVKGSVEMLSYDTKKSDEAQKKFKEDLDLRLTDLEGKLHAPTAPPERTSKANVPEGDEATQYNRILRVYQDKKDYDAAITQFEIFLETHPKGSYAASSQYWLAEACLKKKDYARAVAEYQKVIEKHGKTDKVCDSIYKQGVAFVEMQDPAKAKLFFTDVKARCPKNPAATKATKKLAELAAPKSKQ